jgi:glycosyltransferase involved in cell wall biosynthesis
MTSLPLVTICIPTYNCALYIKQTLLSILKQEYTNIKIKIFDNNSTDDTLSILKEMHNKGYKFEIHTSDINIGAEGNFNRCINASEGDFTAIFHADDLYSPKIINSAISEMQRNPEIVAVCTQAKVIDKNNEDLGQRFVPKELKKQEATNLDKRELIHLVLKYGNFITCPSVVARTTIYKDKIKSWNVEEFKTSADLDVWLRMSCEGKVLFLNQPLMSYRESTASLSFNLFTKRTHRHDLFLVLDKIIENKDLNLINIDDINNYKFLEFKDNALRSFNIIRNLSTENFPKQNFLWPVVLKSGFQSQFHIKYLLIGILILLLKKFFPVFLRKKLALLLK